MIIDLTIEYFVNRIFEATGMSRVISRVILRSTLLLEHLIATANQQKHAMLRLKEMEEGREIFKPDLGSSRGKESRIEKELEH